MFPFLVGCQRSGTTLLRAMFDSHSQMAVPGESHFIPVLAARRERYERDVDQFDVARFVADLTGHPRFQRWELPAGEVRDALEADRPADLAGAFIRLYRCYARRQGKPRFADKTPDYVLQLPLLAGLFDDAVFVHIIRDGRQVAASLLDQEWGASTAAQAAETWVSHVSGGRAAGRSLGPGRYREVRYEDLVEDPAAVLGELCGFVDLEFEDGMLRYHERAEAIRRPVLAKASHTNLSRPPTPNLRDWRAELSDTDLVTIDEIAGDLRRELGYGGST